MSVDEELDLPPAHAEDDTISSEEGAERSGVSRDKVREARRLSGLTIYQLIREEGIEELNRPKLSLLFSGIAAGLAISTSLLAEGVLWAEYEDSAKLHMIITLGYPLGFALVILSRMQLFTENTLSAILPLLATPSRDNFYRTVRLWVIVFFANMVGTLGMAGISLFLQPLPPEYLEGMMEVSRKAREVAGWEELWRGVPAGFFVAAIVWMLPSSKGFELFVIIMFTYLIAAGGFSHVIVGSAKMYLLLWSGEIGLFEALGLNIFPALVGNVIGGTGLFAMLAYGQVHQEM